MLHAPPAIGNGHGPYPGAVTAGHTLDIAAAEQAVAGLLAALGVPPGSETAGSTPRRVAAALAELLTPPAFEFTVFPNISGQHDLVIARQVPFTSLCAHHLLPFTGTACVGTCRASRSPACRSWPGSCAGRRPGCGCRKRWGKRSPRSWRSRWTAPAPG